MHDDVEIVQIASDFTARDRYPLALRANATSRQQAGFGKGCADGEKTAHQAVVWRNECYVDLGLRSQEMRRVRPSRSLIAGSTLVEVSLTVNDLHCRLRDNCEGELATYIPELGNADPN